MNVEKLAKLLANARSMEDLGRKIASWRESRVYRIVDSWANTVHNILSILAEELELVEPQISKLSLNLRDVVEQIGNASQICQIAGVTFGNCKQVLELDVAEKKLERVDRLAKQIFKKKCTWLRGEIKPYNLTSAVNDATACFHRIIEYLEKKFETGKKISEKCFATKEASEEAKKLCKIWNNAVEKMFEQQMYDETDYSELAGYVYDNKIEFTVGSSPGHKTHVDLDEKTLEYYDVDYKVNKTMRKILENIGLKCDYIKEESPKYWLKEVIGVKCEGVEGEKAEKAVKALACATSMDYRLENVKAWWRGLEHVVGECLEKILDEDIEACACKKFLELE